MQDVRISLKTQTGCQDPAATKACIKEVITLLNLSNIHDLAKKERAKIGIGSGDLEEPVKKSIDIAQKNGFAEPEVFYDPLKLVLALKEGKIKGAVRGTFAAHKVLDLLKEEFGLEKIQRIALLSLNEDKLILLAPVGIDEGQGLMEKKELAVYGREFLAKFGEEPKLGILSGGRLEDFGRHPVVDESLDLGRMLTEQTTEMGFDVKHYGILLEKSLESSNFILAPDGISGNLIFRTLHFTGGAKGQGAYVANLPRVFVDTSRAKSDFSDSIALASALCHLYESD
jgi:putative methanogen marker protein 4